MINLLTHYWNRYQFITAIKHGNTRLSEHILTKIEDSKIKLSWLEKLYRNYLTAAQSAYQYKQEVNNLHGKLKQALHRLEELEQLKFNQPNNYILPEADTLDFISAQFKLIQHDDHKLQCTGIDQRVFDAFETGLVDYLTQEFNKYSPVKLSAALKDAHNDIIKLKDGKDPNYSLDLTPHVYFMKYFLENVYGAYLTWFLVYKSGLLPTKINILDIAAGPATMAYGLALLLQSISSCTTIPQTHISYYSLEKQAAFQYRGLQFWRQYMSQQQTATNAFFRFDTTDIFTNNGFEQLPPSFFDFIVISHCFFSDAEQRVKSYQIFKDVFSNCLSNQGYVLLIVQGRKLFSFYNSRPSEDITQENNVVRKFVKDLGLNLKFYNYVTSTGKRTPMKSEFYKFAQANLPLQKQMLELMQFYLGVNHNLHYTLDDYIILASK